MKRVTNAAKRTIKRAKNTWAVVKGTGAAMVASCERLRWEVISSTEVLTHHGETLDLLLDPLAVVKNEVSKAVKNVEVEKCGSQNAAAQEKR